ncbi:MAG TPA: TrkA family potassium uptake protein [Ilumatobacter sp.]|jgi:trk system potassium uptake protein|nr:TrkA family potassium uptake protein [Ilumatobacter sp.]
MSNVLIVGGGRIGGYVGSLLREGGHDVRLIESDPRRADRLRSELAPDLVVLGSGTDPDVLEAAGARRSDSVVALTERDETNLVVTSLARFEFAVPRTIARVNNPANAWLYTAEMGVDVALNQADIIGHLVAEEMSLGEMTTLLKLRRGSFALVEEQVHPTSAAAGRSIADLPLPSECILVGVLRENDVITPHGDTVLVPGDEVLAIVRTDAAPLLAGLLGAR